MFKYTFTLLLILIFNSLAYSQTVYKSEDGLINYQVPQGFKLSDVPKEYHNTINPDYKMAYRSSNTGVNPSILINVATIESNSLKDASFIYRQRDLLRETYPNVSIESVTSFSSTNHPDILNALFLVETDDDKFYNSIYYFLYTLNSNETIMWTMTCTYSYKEKNLYSRVFKETAKSFVFNN